MTHKIIEILQNTLLVDELHPEEDLFDAGYLDSLAIINLMVNLEQAFDITLAPETLNIDEFRSAKSIEKLVESLPRTTV